MRTLVAALLAMCLAAVVHGQGGIASAPAKFLVPPTQVVAIRAGRLFDSRTGSMLSNQIILIRGDRIADVGPAVAIPSDARVIDLSSATVMPGMIDGHVHVYPADDLSQSTRTIVAVANAQADLEAGFTTVLDMDSRGGYGTVDLRDAINRGVVLGPRMQVVGQSLNQRAARPYPSFFERFQDRFTESKNPNSPWLGQGGGARGQAARRRLGEDLHDAGFRRRRVQRLQAGRHAREQSVAHRRRGDGDHRRGPSPWPQGRLSHLRRRRAAQLPEGGCRCAESPHRSRCRLVEAARRQEAPLHADRRRPRLARSGGSEEDRRTEQSSEDGRAGVQEGLRGRRAVRVRQRSDVRRDPARQTGRPVRLLHQVGHGRRWTR